MNIHRIILFFILPLSIYFFSLSAIDAAEAKKPQALQDSKDINSINISKKNIEKKITSRHDYFESTLNKLHLIEKRYRNSSDKNLKDDLLYVEDVWRGFVERSFSNMSSEFLQDDLPKITKVEPFLETKNTSEKVSQHYNIFDSWLNKKIDDDQNLYNSVLLLSGKLRAKLVQENSRKGNEYIDPFTRLYFEDLINEIQIIPTRWAATFVSKIYDWKRNVSIGVKGLKFILINIILMLSALISVFFLIFNFRRISSSIEDFGRSILDSQMRKYDNFAYYIFYLINTVSSLLIVLILINIGGALIRLSNVKELSELVNLANYYIFYRMTIIVITRGITKLKIDGKVRFSYVFYKDFFNSIRLSAFVLFLYFSLLQVIDTVVGRVLLYNLIDAFFSYFIWAIIVYEIWVWRDRINVLFDRFIPNFILIRSVALHLEKVPVMRPLFQLISVMFSLFLLFFNNLLSKTKLSSHISSYVFIRKVKAAYSVPYALSMQDSALLMKNYSSLLLCRQNNLFNIAKEEAKEIVSFIRDWHLQKSMKNSISITGDKGSGLSVVMDQVQEMLEEFTVLRLNLHCNCSKIEDFLVYMSEVLNVSISSIHELESVLLDCHEKKPFVIIIDDAHHLFMGKFGGFDVVRSVISLMSNDRLQVFWVASYNSFSLKYLQMVFSRAELAQIEMLIKPWDADDIQNLVLHRHKQTNIEISFDDLALALKTDTGVQLKEIENQYFKLLADKSSGNPGSALALWCKSLYPSHKNNTLNIGLPKSLDFNIEKKLNNDLLLLLSCINKHGSLTRGQIEEVALLERGKIVSGLKDLILWGIIDLDDYQYFSISCEFAPKVYKILKRMNLIYG